MTPQRSKYTNLESGYGNWRKETWPSSSISQCWGKGGGVTARLKTNKRISQPD